MRNLFLALVLCACGGYDPSFEGGDAADDAHLGIRKGQGQVVDQGDAAGEAQGGQAGGTISTGGLPNTGGLQTGGVQNMGGMQTGGAVASGGTQAGGTQGTGGAPVCVPIPELLNGRDDDCDGVIDNGVPGVVHFEEHAYFVAGTNALQKDAKKTCETAGYNLVRVDSAQENEFLQLQGLFTPHKWLRATDLEKEGVWRDDEGPLTYTNWTVGQPNDCDKTRPDGVFDPTLPCGPEDCAVSGTTWRDLSCETQRSSVLCEADLK